VRTFADMGVRGSIFCDSVGTSFMDGPQQRRNQDFTKGGGLENGKIL